SVEILLFFFFLKAEEGIRDDLVTGVQTCALPISNGPSCKPGSTRTSTPPRACSCRLPSEIHVAPAVPEMDHRGPGASSNSSSVRSEERRVGKGRRAGRARHRRQPGNDRMTRRVRV